MSKIETKNIAKYSMMISAILVLSKIIGFIREFLVASQLGAGVESDVFKTATRIPNLFYGCVAAALVTSFIPIFSSIKNDREQANKFFNNIFNVVLILCILLALLGMLFSSPLAHLFVPFFTVSELIKTSYMTKITMPAIIFLSLSGLMTGYLQSYGVFFQSALTSIVSSIIMIVGMLLIPQFGMVAAIIGFLIGSVAQVIFQRPFMKEYKYKFYINFKDINLRKMLLLSIPVLVSTAVAQVNVIVDSSFGSGLPAGSISIIDYASKISTIINQVFIVSITTILYPMLTEKYSLQNKGEFENLIIKSVNIVIIVTIPLLFGVIALSTPLIQLLLQHGAFKVEDTQITSLCLKYLALGTLGYSLMDILGKVFFSIKDTVTPMINGFITVVLNILFIVVLVPQLGVSGLAIATTSSATIMAGVMFYELKKRLKNIAFKNFIIVIIKAIAAGILMCVLVSLTYKYVNLMLDTNSVIYLTIKIVIATIVGIISYLAMLKIFRVEELNSVFSLKKSRVK